jgi:hypothetical protein
MNQSFLTPTILRSKSKKRVCSVFHRLGSFGRKGILSNDFPGDDHQERYAYEPEQVEYANGRSGRCPSGGETPFRAKYTVWVRLAHFTFSLTLKISVLQSEPAADWIS